MLAKPLYNSSDLVDHEGVAAVVKDADDKILMFYHKKFEFWTIPIGKAAPDETAYEGLCTELREECGITVKAATEIATQQYVSERNGVEVRLNSHVYLIDDYTGEPTNCEPEKHLKMEFQTVEGIKAHSDLSDATLLYLETIG